MVRPDNDLKMACRSVDIRIDKIQEILTIRREGFKWMLQEEIS